MKKPLIAFLALTTVLVAIMLPAAASPSTGGVTRVLRTKALVRHIAANGARVAVVATSKTGACDARIIVWGPKTRSLRWFAANPSATCSDPELMGDVAQVALTAKGVAWLQQGGGNLFELGLGIRTLGAKKTKGIAHAKNSNGAEFSPDGDWIGNVVAHRNLLAYNRWHLCTAYPEGLGDEVNRCEQPSSGGKTSFRFSSQTLDTWENGKSHVIASAPDEEAPSLKTAGQLVLPYSLAIVAVDSSRIATQLPSGPVTIYSPNGTVLAEIAIPSGKFAGTALQGSQLVTLRNNKIELYQISSGALAKTFSVAAGSRLRDLQSGLVVYVSGRKVHVLRLSDGSNATWAPPGKGAVDAQIEPPGPFYSYNLKSEAYLARFPNTKAPGRVAFVPFVGVLKKLG